MDTIEIAWLAGLLEGEGCFAPRGMIALAMADKDVIERAAKLMNGKIRMAKKGPHKPSYGVVICGTRARTIMSVVLPYMGERRSRKIKELLANPNWGFPDSTAAAHTRAGITTRSMTMGEAEMIRRIYSVIRGPSPIVQIARAYRRSYHVIRHICRGRTYLGLIGSLESKKSYAPEAVKP